MLGPCGAFNGSSSALDEASATWADNLSRVTMLAFAQTTRTGGEQALFCGVPAGTTSDDQAGVVLRYNSPRLGRRGCQQLWLASCTAA